MFRNCKTTLFILAITLVLRDGIAPYCHFCPHVYAFCNPGMLAAHFCIVAFQNLLNDLGMLVSTGRTSTLKDDSGVWSSSSGIVVLPVDTSTMPECMLQAQVFDDCTRPPTLLSETMIWLRDVLERARMSTLRDPKGMARPFPQEQARCACPISAHILKKEYVIRVVIVSQTTAGLANKRPYNV